MKSKAIARTIALVLVSLTIGVTSVSAAERKGELHVTKECSQYTGAAGSFCTITSSNLSEITVGSRVFYDQAAGIPAALLDSNVVLDAGDGNRAVGRCTLDVANARGLCTFSDGTGQFAGFKARIDVTKVPNSAADWNWNGTYSFSPVPDTDAR